MKSRRVIIGVLSLILAGTASGLAQQSAEGLFQAGLHEEEVQGNLEEAISTYGRILEDFPDDRPVAARALMHIGLCHEKLGSREAQRAYDRLVREYWDQTDVVEQAQARLASLGGPAQVEQKVLPAANVRRLLFRDERGCHVFGMRPSPDGRRLAYSDFCKTGAVFVRDLETGETERVAEGWAMGAVWSPDGTKLAVGDMKWERATPRVIDLTTGSSETPAALQGLAFMPRDWAVGGEWLTGTLTDPDNTVSSCLVSLRTGEVVTLAERVKQGADDSAFSPDGRYVAYTDFVDGNQDVYAMALETGERHRITTEAAAEGGALWSPDGKTIIYQGKPGMWAVRIDEGQPDGQPRLLVRTGQSVGPAAWTASGYYYVVSNGLTRAYRVPVDPGTGEPAGSAEPFPEAGGRLWMAWSPDMQQLASAGWGDREHIHLSRSRSSTAFSIGNEIMTSNLWWSGDGQEILFTTAARGTRDKRKTVFALDPSDGAVRELFPKQDSIHHLHVSPDGRRMLFVRDTESDDVFELRVSELGDPHGSVLVSASTSDPEGGLSLAYGQPRFSPDGKQILFVRQNFAGQGDFSSGLWVVPSDGSEPPRRLVTGPLIHRPVWDPSGRFIAFSQADPESRTLALYTVTVETGEKHEFPGVGNTDSRAWSPDGRWIAVTQILEGGWEYWVTEDPLRDRTGSP